MWIVLKDLRFFAYHGVMEQEQKTGDYFICNLRLQYDYSSALRTDNIKETLDYGSVFEIVKREMNQPSKLMEHVAGRICKVLFQTFSKLTAIELSIMKENPPIGADCGGAGVELYLERDSVLL